MATARSTAFTDDRGNRFIFPGWIVRDDDDAAPLVASQWGQACFIAARTGCTHEVITFDPDAFPNVPTSAGSGVFAHGSSDVLLFAGPTFDSVAADLKAA